MQADKAQEQDKSEGDAHGPEKTARIFFDLGFVEERQFQGTTLLKHT